MAECVVSNPDLELTPKEWSDITKLIKVLSESIKVYVEGIKDPANMPGKDVSLMAMQVLSLLCGMSRGYSKADLDKIWSTSIKASNKIRASREQDKIEPGLQKSILSGSKTKYKN